MFWKGAFFAMYEIPVFTGNKLKDSILYLVLSAVRIDRDSLILLHPSYKYLSKVIRDLTVSGYITVSNTRPQIITISQAALELTKDVNERTYNYYMRISNNNHRTNNLQHELLKKRAAEIVTAMFASEINVGGLKPSLAEIEDQQLPKLTLDTPTFYLNKELKYTVEQIEARAHITRSSGVVFSKGICAQCYNTIGRQMHVLKRAELEANIRLISYCKSLYADLPRVEIRDSILFCPDYNAAIEIVTHTGTENRKKKTIADCIDDRTITGTSFRLIPLTREGITLLSLITKLTREDFLNACFQEDERAAAKRARIGEGIINGLYCYEFLSCNVTKLSFIKRNHPDLSKVGIICWDPQIEFIRNYFGENTPRIRSVKQDRLFKYLGLEGGESIVEKN